MKKVVVLFIAIIITLNYIPIDYASCKDTTPKKSTKKQSNIITQKEFPKRQCKIEGIGIFKIGKTNIDIIKDLENEFGTTTVILSHSCPK